MQISIEQHETVMKGLVAEMNIQHDLLVEAKADVEILRSDVSGLKKDRNLLTEQLTSKSLEYERMLERIRQVATGEFPPCTRAGASEWSVALAEVEVLFVQSETARANSRATRKRRRK
jgi:hypothetical protein